MLCASKIHDESKLPIKILRLVPQDHYHKEVFEHWPEMFPSNEIFIVGKTIPGASHKQ